MLRIKICGITNAADALLACELGADAIGFIFYEKSPRCIRPEQATEIARQLPAHVARVGVFVNTPPPEIAGIMEQIGLNVAQLHGDYPLSAYDHFRPEQVIAVARVSETFHPADLAQFQGKAAAILLDTQKKGLYGGTGEVFDWQAAVAAKAYGHIILAGGLTPDNVRQAVETVHPYALDVSSGVEAAPGKKDHAKLRRLFENINDYRCDWQRGNAPSFPIV